MDALFGVAFLIYMIVFVTAQKKSKERKAAADAARKRAMRLAEEENVPPAEGESAMPATPPVSAADTRPQHRERSQQARHQPVQPARMQAAPVTRASAPPQTRMRTTMNTQLTEIAASSRHDLKASSMAPDGHVHEETSMSGIQQDCASTAVRKQVVNTVPVVSASVNSVQKLAMDAAAVRQAMIYSEILGKPKALRR